MQLECQGPDGGKDENGGHVVDEHPRGRERVRPLGCGSRGGVRRVRPPCCLIWVILRRTRQR